MSSFASILWTKHGRELFLFGANIPLVRLSLSLLPIHTIPPSLFKSSPPSGLHEKWQPRVTQNTRLHFAQGHPEDTMAFVLPACVTKPPRRLSPRARSQTATDSGTSSTYIHSSIPLRFCHRSHDEECLVRYRAPCYSGEATRVSDAALNLQHYP